MTMGRSIIAQLCLRLFLTHSALWQERKRFGSSPSPQNGLQLGDVGLRISNPVLIQNRLRFIRK